MKSITFIYRSTGDESPNDMVKKARPKYFSKTTCLKSFLYAASKLTCKKQFFFPNDTPIPKDRLDLMKKYGTVIDTKGKGNVESCRFIYRLAKKQNTDYVYFAEDDFLHLENSFTEMLRGFDSIKNADYLTLYNAYDKTSKFLKHKHWNPFPSATMTWGAHLKTFKKDAYKFHLFSLGIERRDGLFRKYIINKILSFGILFPNWDENAWHFILGRAQYFFIFPKRKLFASFPSLACHCNANFMAPFVDWEKFSKKADRFKV